MYREGTIGLDGLNNSTILAHFWIKVYDTGSEYGIDGGRISKLTIKIDGQIVANYDRGWDIEPATPEAKEAYTIILNEYN